jgi:hypothetical protein
LLEERAEFVLGEEILIMEPGDSMSYDATVEHAITALEK